MTCNLRHPTGFHHPVCATWLIYLRCDSCICASAAAAWCCMLFRALHQGVRHDLFYSYVRQDWFICATWLIHTCDVTRWYVQRDSLICATSLIYLRRDSFILRCCCVSTMLHARLERFVKVCASSLIRITRLIHMRDVTHCYRVAKTRGMPCIHSWRCVRHRSVMFATRCIHTCDTTHLYVRHDSFIRATRLIYTCDTT